MNDSQNLAQESDSLAQILKSQSYLTQLSHSHEDHHIFPSDSTSQCGYGSRLENDPVMSDGEPDDEEELINRRESKQKASQPNPNQVTPTNPNQFMLPSPVQPTPPVSPVASRDIRTSRITTRSQVRAQRNDNSEELFWSEVESRVDTIVSSRKSGMITRAAGLRQAAQDYENKFRNYPCKTSQQEPQHPAVGSVNGGSNAEEVTGTTSSYSISQPYEQGCLHLHSDMHDADGCSLTPQCEVDGDEEDDTGEDDEKDDEDGKYVDEDNEDDEKVDEDNRDDEEVDEDNEDDDREQESHYERELLSFLEHFKQVEHPVCEWKLEGDDACIVCHFQLYQKDCVQALKDDELSITDIADAMAIIGVLVPFLQTRRMRAIFNKKTLSQLAVLPPLPDPSIDDAAVLRAVRLSFNNKLEDASKELLAIDRKMRLMFENLLEFLPDKVDRAISEVTFTVNYVASVLNGILKIDAKTNIDFVNTNWPNPLRHKVDGVMVMDPITPEPLRNLEWNDMFYLCRVVTFSKNSAAAASFSFPLLDGRVSIYKSDKSLHQPDGLSAFVLDNTVEQANVQRIVTAWDWLLANNPLWELRASSRPSRINASPRGSPL
ncbi:hypothetical protein BGX27_000621 [Mortierella sp. AM989]|nr:hypothetical protein BGX27_000621 [Mortierella sp. AM989]